MSKITISAGVIVVRRFSEEPKYLLLRAYQYWDFPKGMVTPGEDPFDAALREVFEETGLQGLDFRWGTEYRETPPYGRGKIARYYVAEAAAGEVFLPVSPELGHPEHDEFRWLTYQAARKLVPERVQPILDWAASLIQSQSGK